MLLPLAHCTYFFMPNPIGTQTFVLLGFCLSLEAAVWQTGGTASEPRQCTEEKRAVRAKVKLTPPGKLLWNPPNSVKRVSLILLSAGGSDWYMWESAWRTSFLWVDPNVPQGNLTECIATQKIKGLSIVSCCFGFTGWRWRGRRGESDKEERFKKAQKSWKEINKNEKEYQLQVCLNVQLTFRLEFGLSLPKFPFFHFNSFRIPFLLRGFFAMLTTLCNVLSFIVLSGINIFLRWIMVICRTIHKDDAWGWVWLKRLSGLSTEWSHAL